MIDILGIIVVLLVGYSLGHHNGKMSGHSTGYSDGYSTGHEKGYKRGKVHAIRDMLLKGHVDDRRNDTTDTEQQSG